MRLEIFFILDDLHKYLELEDLLHLCLTNKYFYNIFFNVFEIKKNKLIETISNSINNFFYLKNIKSLNFTVNTMEFKEFNQTVQTIKKYPKILNKLDTVDKSLKNIIIDCYTTHYKKMKRDFCLMDTDQSFIYSCVFCLHH